MTYKNVYKIAVWALDIKNIMVVIYICFFISLFFFEEGASKNTIGIRDI